jgi:hypothetical protein
MTPLPSDSTQQTAVILRRVPEGVEAERMIQRRDEAFRQVRGPTFRVLSRC